ncbi:MAG: proton-conducting transporter membrane subunit [Thermoleophilia bacterium]
MTSWLTVLAILTIAVPVLGGALCALARDRRLVDALNRVTALAGAGVATALGVVALVRADDPAIGRVFVVDAPAGVFLLVIAVVGLLSALVSPAHLRKHERSFFRADRARGWYYLALHAFWAALLAVPVLGNLGLAWLVVEATTAASALLVAFSGKRSALEAGWKYLVLTTVGLTVALLGIVVLYAGSSPEEGRFALLDWGNLGEAAAAAPQTTALVAFALILVGLAAKIGWAPVHNWLPDAHSEAPPPVSALLSAALLPTVMLVAWRVKTALEPVVGEHATRAVFLGFGLASLAVAVPFLWRPLAWKRLLAYSSLEHMGVLALGIGFAHPLAVAGVLLHVCGHALAKSLGFYAAIPLLREQPTAASRPPTGVARTSPATAGALGLSLGSLSGLPPSPLFFSEVFVLLGGILAGQLEVAAAAAVLLALGFLGLAHALIEGLVGKARGRAADAADARWTRRLSLGVGAGLVGLTAAAYFLPGSGIVDAITRWSGG